MTRKEYGETINQLRSISEYYRSNDDERAASFFGNCASLIYPHVVKALLDAMPILVKGDVVKKPNLLGYFSLGKILFVMIDGIVKSYSECSKQKG